MNFNIQIFLFEPNVATNFEKLTNTTCLSDMHAYTTCEIFMHHYHRYLTMNYGIK
jgi:hypothetical protein